MAFDTYEESDQSGEPVELYHFTRGTISYRFNSGKIAIEYSGADFPPAILTRSAIDLGDDGARSAIKITCQRDFPIAELFRVRPPSETVMLTLHRLHPADGNGIVAWIGRVLNAEWSGAKAVLSCEPVGTAMSRPGLRRFYSRSCPHVLYGPACRLNKEDWRWTVTVSAITVVSNGIRIESAALTSAVDGWFTGGFIEFSLPDGTVERRRVITDESNYVIITAAIAGLAVGSVIFVYLGCNHTTNMCRTLFDNLLNYGGFPYIPIKSPFDGSALY